jgi:hypothetical protein
MPERFSCGYLRLLWTFEILLFPSSFLIHVSVLAGATNMFKAYGHILSFTSILIWVLVAAFIKDSPRWTDQIKICPIWMRKTTLVLGVYILSITCLQLIVVGMDEQSLLESCIPLGVDAFAVCIIYSVLYAGYLGRSELLRRTVGSLAMAALIVITLLAYHAGYLPHPKSD